MESLWEFMKDIDKSTFAKKGVNSQTFTLITFNQFVKIYFHHISLDDTAKEYFENPSSAKPWRSYYKKVLRTVRERFEEKDLRTNYKAVRG